MSQDDDTARLIEAAKRIAADFVGTGQPLAFGLAVTVAGDLVRSLKVPAADRGMATHTQASRSLRRAVASRQVRAVALVTFRSFHEKHSGHLIDSMNVLIDDIHHCSDSIDFWYRIGSGAVDFYWTEHAEPTYSFFPRPASGKAVQAILREVLDGLLVWQPDRLEHDHQLVLPEDIMSGLEQAMSRIRSAPVRNWIELAIIEFSRALEHSKAGETLKACSSTQMAETYVRNALARKRMKTKFVVGPDGATEVQN